MHTAVGRFDALTPKQIARFWSRIDSSDLTGCWPWTGTLHEGGYGTWTVNVPGGGSTSIRPHRLALHLTRVPLKDGSVVDHTCGRRACCNPAHLDEVRHDLNAARVSHDGGRMRVETIVRALEASTTAEQAREWWSNWLSLSAYGRRSAEQDLLRSLRPLMPG